MIRCIHQLAFTGFWGASAMKKALATILFVLFGVSAVIHFATYFGVLIGDVPGVFILHLTAIGAGILMQRTHTPRKRKRAIRIRTWHIYTESMPTWLRRAVNWCGYYAILNFVLCFILLSQSIDTGVPIRIDGEYVELTGQAETYVSKYAAAEHSITGTTVSLDNIPVRRMTENDITYYTPASEEDYRKGMTPVMRVFTGHWMAFHLLTAGYFWYLDNPAKAKRKAKAA